MATASPLRADEFTAEQYIEKSKKLGKYTTYDSSRGGAEKAGQKWRTEKPQNQA
jgi:hypothetical protein